MSRPERGAYFYAGWVVHYVTGQESFSLAGETCGVKHALVYCLVPFTWEVTAAAVDQFLFGSKKVWVLREVRPTVV